MKHILTAAIFLNAWNLAISQQLDEKQYPADSSKVVEIQKVEVIGRKESSYKNTISFSGTKTGLALKETPQSIGYVTKELILDQGAITVNDVVKNISGVSQYSFYNDFSIRGFRVQGNKIVGGGNLINGMKAQTSFWKPMSLANIERVEIIKGPSSALFGNASPGGVINRVTKKPLLERRRSIAMGIGSFNTFNVYTDFTGPLDDKKTLLYRLNLGYETTDSFRDLQGSDNIIIAPSFSFLPTPKTRINVDLFYQNMNGKLDRAQSVFGDGDLYSTPINRSLSSANDYLKEKLFNTTISLSHSITENLSFNSTFLLSIYNEDLREHSQANAYVMKADGSTDYTKVLMRALLRKRDFRNNTLNTFLNYKLNTGDFKHNILLGYDYFNAKMLPSSSQMSAGGYLLKNGTSTPRFNPKNIKNYLLDKDGNPITNVPYFDLTKGNEGNAMKDISKYYFERSNLAPTEQYSHGFYIQEHIEYNFLKLLLSMRAEFFTDEYLNAKTQQVEKIQQSAFIPRVGLVAEVNKNINLYGTWVKGFEPQSASIQSDPLRGGPFDPEYSELFEVGTKTEWFNKRLNASVSLFNIKKFNTLYAAPTPQFPDRMEQIGEEVSKGIELDVAGFIAPYWSITTSYSYNDAKITKTKTGSERDFGKQRPNTPKHSGNIWTKYFFTKGLLKNIGVAMGYNFSTERFGQVARRENTIVYPSYSVFNAALFYKVNRTQLQVNVNNIFNKTYWVGGYDKLRSFPGTPRNINMVISYKF